MEIIIGKQGNQKITITEPTVSRKHCKVTNNGDGTYIIENLSPNGTKVNGTNIIRTIGTLDSILELGPSFKATLRELIGTSVESNKSNVNYNVGNNLKPSIPTPEPKPEIKTYNIAHLKNVWEDYNNKNIENADAQRKVTLVRSGAMIVTMGGGLVATLAALPVVGGIFTGVGVISMIYSFVGMKKAESAKERQRRQEEFDDAWVCPNPSCGKTLLAKNYKMLVKNHQSCPYCKSKYVEK